MATPALTPRDVFVSYGHADADWVRRLAGNLHQAGLDVAFDEWDIGPGDVLIHRLDAMILASRDGILVVSPASMQSRYVQEEYAALLQRAIEGGKRLIPVLLRDAEMPPLLASRIWIDFRNADGPDYVARVEQLVRALKGTRPGPPARTGVLVPPPDTRYSAVGARECRLVISTSRTALIGDGVDVVGRPPQADFDFGELRWRLERARNLGTVRESRDAAAGRGELDVVLREWGEALAAAFVSTDVEAALRAAIGDAVRLHGALRVALDIDDRFADLPWETLRLPHSEPLVLQPGVEVFRRIETHGSAPAVSIPGPLRILVAIGSPEAQNARGELLDVEAELQRILDATERPRRAGKAFVHILEQGSVKAIHDALVARRYHVLHISCHAAPGTLILETSDGGEDRVTAKRLCDAAIPAERAAPLIVLAGCSTARDETVSREADAGRLPGLARALVTNGVPSVIAMQAPVGDRYATELMGGVYEALANQEQPLPLAALSHARRDRETSRLAHQPAPLPAEWATPAFLASASPLRLYDPTTPFEELQEAPDPVFDPGVVVRRIGDLVGRRREQRLILRALRDPNGSGALLHGMGGVGKSTLAAQVLHRLADDDAFLLVSLEGETDPDRILDAIGRRLFTRGLEAGWDENHRMRRLASVLREPKYAWRERFESLATLLLAQIPVAFLFDNFEDNLHEAHVRDAELAAFLAQWLQAPGLSRLVFTCRYPFALPEEAQDRLSNLHLGPLSWAETRKLLWRLDGLKQLSLDDQRRAYEQVGGHPRALEYLDAILRGGHARFIDVTRRLKQQLSERGIADPAQWCADTIGGLDGAVAETVTLAADDVLLDQLLNELDDDPLARRLLLGAAVYRQPVDDVALAWRVGEPAEHAQSPERTARLAQMDGRLREARRANPSVELRQIFTVGEIEQYRADFADEHRPPIEAPAGLGAARQRLLASSLLATVRSSDVDEELFLVHRWTAAALARRASHEDQADAHRAAAAYWRWRATARPQSREQDIADMLEARHHSHIVGDLKTVEAITFGVCAQLDTWGAWEWEERLLRETLSWLPAQSEALARCLHQLGKIAHHRGDYDAAQETYRQSLAISERLGMQRGVAASYHQLGMVAQTRGDLDTAFDWYQKALAIVEQLDDPRGLASSYHQMGLVAQLRGDHDAARDWYGKSLAIEEQVGNRDGIATSYQQLGRLEQIRGDYGAAHDFYRRALAIQEQLGARASMAISYHQLGIIAQHHKDYRAALGWYRKALAIDEQLGDREGTAAALSQIGVVHTETLQAETAVPFNLKGLEIRLDLGVREARIDLYWLSRQRHMLGHEVFGEILAKRVGSERVPLLLTTLDDFERQLEQTTGSDAPRE